MPSRAARLCAHGGCRARAENGPHCSAHAVSVRAARPYDAWRGSSASRGYNAEWRRRRVQALARDGYRCQANIGIGREVVLCNRPATDVHHKVTVLKAPHLRLDMANLVSLCHECHSRITAKRDSTFAHKRTP